MRKLLWITVPASVMIAGAGLYLANQNPEIQSKSFNMAKEPLHPVTHEMEHAAGGKTGDRAPEFRLKDQSGVETTLTQLRSKGPVVLVMTLDGCPCNIESQPYFNQIAEALKGKVAFAGIMNADQSTATLYQKSLKVPYPMLSETTGMTYTDYESEQSVYTYLIDKDGVIAKVWPGYSGAMLAELYQMAAALAKTDGPEISFKNAPSELSSGCYFFRPEKNLRVELPKG